MEPRKLTHSLASLTAAVIAAAASALKSWSTCLDFCLHACILSDCVALPLRFLFAYHAEHRQYPPPHFISAWALGCCTRPAVPSTKLLHLAKLRNVLSFVELLNSYLYAAVQLPCHHIHAGREVPGQAVRL